MWAWSAKLVLNHTGDVPTGYIPLRPKTYNPATNAGMTIARLEAHRGPVGPRLAPTSTLFGAGSLDFGEPFFFPELCLKRATILSTTH